jgi:outer membrane protein assembly factor BamB
MKSKVPFTKGEHSLQRRMGVIAVVLVLTFLLASLAVVFNLFHPSKNASAGSQLGVYAGSGDGAIFKLDAANGQQLWRYKTKGNSIPAPVTDVNGMIYAGGLDGFVYALSTTDGKVNWSFQTQGPVLSSPIVANGVVYVGSSDGNLYALDAQKGTPIWHYYAGPATVAVDVHTVVVSNGVIYGSSSDNVAYSYLFALDAKSGTQLWQTQVKDQNFTAPQVNSGVI